MASSRPFDRAPPLPNPPPPRRRTIRWLAVSALIARGLAEAWGDGKRADKRFGVFAFVLGWKAGIRELRDARETYRGGAGAAGHVCRAGPGQCPDRADLPADDGFIRSRHRRDG